MSKEEKIFRFSVMSDLGDSVVGEGSVAKGTYQSKYFNHYEKAVEYLTEQCREFVREENKEVEEMFNIRRIRI